MQHENAVYKKSLPCYRLHGNRLFPRLTSSDARIRGLHISDDINDIIIRVEVQYLY